MKKYTAEEIENFLLAIDGFLTTKTSIIIIGGTAAALAYKVSMATQDIDTWNSTQKLTKAYEQAKELTQLNIPMSQVSVGDAPHNFEERLIPYQPKKFKNLSVLIPEVADLILMKTLRGYEHDLEAIEEMVNNEAVPATVLIQRYEEEMKAVVGNKRKLDTNFLAMIERCFGTSAAQKAAQKIGYK